MQESLKHFVELFFSKYAELPNRPSSRIGRNALNQKRPRFQERHLDRGFICRSPYRRCVRDHRHEGAVDIPERNASDQNRADFRRHAQVEESDLTARGGHVPLGLAS